MILKPNENIPNCVGIIRKSNRRIIVYLAVFLTNVVFGGFTLMAAEPNENTAQRVVGSFLKQLAENRITRIEVYYMSLSRLTSIAITEDFLRDHHYEYKVIAIDPNLAEVAKSLREFKFENIDLQISDFRWGCVFYAENEEILRLFFPGAPMVAVNGAGYKATPELIRSLTQFLPVKAYKDMNETIEEMNEAIEKQLGLFRPVSPKQQATPHEQKKSDKP
jgi:hypothetical protein